MCLQNHHDDTRRKYCKLTIHIEAVIRQTHIMCDCWRDKIRQLRSVLFNKFSNIEQLLADVQQRGRCVCILISKTDISLIDDVANVQR